MLVFVDNIKYRSNRLTQSKLFNYFDSLNTDTVDMSDVLMLLMQSKKNIILEGTIGFTVKSDTLKRIINHYFNNNNAAIKYIARLQVNNELENNEKLKNHLSLIHFITNNHPELLYYFDKPITPQLLDKLDRDYFPELGNPVIRPMSRNTFRLRKEIEKKAPSLEKCLLLVQHGANPAIFNSHGDNLLHVVVKRRQLLEIENTSISLHPEQKDIYGRTALQHLMDLKNVSWYEMNKLLQLGADPDTELSHKGKIKYYLIHNVVSKLNIMNFRSFLTFAPNLDVVDSRGQTALDILLNKLNHQHGIIERGVIVELCNMLLDSGATPPLDFNREILNAPIEALKPTPRYFSGKNPVKNVLFLGSASKNADLTDFTPPRGKGAGERRIAKPIVS